jgi:WD40 repeat protein
LLGLGPWNHKQLSVVEAHTGKLVQSLPIDDYMNDFDINPDCTKLVTVSDRHRLKIWNLVNGKELATPELGPDDQYISRAAFSPDGRWLITDQTRQHALRGAQTGKVVFQLKAGLGSYSFSPREPVFSPDGKRVVTIWNSAPEIAWVWDTQTGKLVSSFTCAEFGGRHLGPVSFSQDGEWIAMAFGSASANIWEAATGKELQVLRGHGAGVNSVVFSADKNLVLTASDDRTVRVWDALTGEVRAVFQGHEEPVVSARFIPDGNVLSIDKKGAARVWPVDPLAAARIRATRQLTDGERKRYEITTQNQ